MGCLWSASGTGLSVTVSSSTSWTTPAVRSSRFCFTPYVFWLAGLFVFLKYLFKDARKYANAPGLFGGRGEMAMAVPCCPLRSSAACGSESRLIGSLCSVSVVISNGLQPSLEGLGPRPSLSTVGRKPGHDSPWTLLRAPTQSGGPQATTSLSTVGCKPGHDTSRNNTVPASTGKTSTETSVRRSVSFNPQGWETVFGRYPREVSRSTAVDAGDTHWAHGSTQWY